LPQFFSGQGQVEEDVGVLRAESGCFFIGLRRLGVLLLLKEDDSQVVMGRGCLGGQGYDPVEPVAGIAQLALLEKKQGQEVAQLRVVRVVGQQGLIAGLGLLEIAILVELTGLVKKSDGGWCRHR
jgi:hypothetical protein